MGANIPRAGGQYIIQLATDDLVPALTQDPLGSAVAQSDLLFNIGSNHPTCNGRKNVVRQVFEPGHFVKRVADRGEEAGIFYGNCRLVGKDLEQVAFGLVKDT